MLGPVDLTYYLPDHTARAMGDAFGVDVRCATLDWVICGGETGSNARPMHPDWVKSLRNQCQAAGVPFWFKGWGEWGPSHQSESYYCKGKEIIVDNMYFRKVGHKNTGRLLDGWEWNERPEVKT
jgi:protein gp37